MSMWSKIARFGKVSRVLRDDGNLCLSRSILPSLAVPYRSKAPSRTIKMNGPKPGNDQIPPIPCFSPRHEAIQGHYVQLIPTKADHAGELYRAVGGSEKSALYDYMPYGPFDDEQSLRNRIALFETSQDPLFWTIRHLESGKLLGWLSMLRIDTVNRVVEIGHIMYAP